MIQKDRAALEGADANHLSELARQLRSAVAGIRERKTELDQYLPKLRERHVSVFRAHVRSLTELVHRARESLQKEGSGSELPDSRQVEEKLLLLSKAMDEMVEHSQRSLRSLEERVAQNGLRAEGRADQIEESLRHSVQELDTQLGRTARALEEVAHLSDTLQRESRSAEQRVAVLEAQAADSRFRIQQLLVQSDQDRVRAAAARRWLWMCVAVMTVALIWCLYIVL